MTEYMGDRLRTLRENAGLQLAQVAKLLGVERTTVCHYECGTQKPSLDVLVRYAEIFHVATDYLLGRVVRDQIDVSGLTASEVDLINRLVISMKVKNEEQKIQ